MNCDITVKHEEDQLLVREIKTEPQIIKSEIKTETEECEDIETLPPINVFAPLENISEGVLLVNESEAFERWRKLPIAIQFKVYLFNVTNPDDVMQGANPILQEVGPYCYDQYREKYDIEFEENDTLSYYENMTLYFNQKMSGDVSPDDVVNVLNAALLGSVLTVSKQYGTSSLGMMESILRDVFVDSESMFITAPVKNILWEGVTIINCTHSKFICNMIRTQVPRTVVETSPGIFDFSYFGYKNNSNNGRFRINRGTTDSERLGHIQAWQDEASVNNWLGPTCNMINGTDSTIFPPFRKSSDKLYIFVTDVCRSLHAEFEGNVKIQGVPALRFIASKYLLADGRDYPPNLCFCDGEEDASPDELICLKPGALDLYNCLKVPLILTFPHFYNAAPEYLSYAEGLQPKKEIHETFTDLEPNTGIPLQGAKRIQMNMFLAKIQELSVLNNVSEGLFPMVWIEEGAILTGNNMAAMKLLHVLLCCCAILKWLLPAIGILLMVITICFCARCSSDKEAETQTKNEIKMCFGNKTFVSEPEILNRNQVTNKTLMISDLNNLIQTEGQTPRKRLIDKFPGKSHTTNSRKNMRSVGLNVTNDFDSTISLSNVFM